MSTQNTPSGSADHGALPVFNKEQTAELIDFASLIEAIAQAATEYDASAIKSPPRLVVPIAGSGVMLSMPATASDIAIHKLVNVQPANVPRRLPTINGLVTVCDAQTGQAVCVLDGPEVTGRRTVAVTLLAIRSLLPQPPRNVLIYGTGAQASYHIQGLKALYPHLKLYVRGLNDADAAGCCQRHTHLYADMSPCPAALPADIDVVITVTTATEPVYDEPAVPGRLVIGVGAFKPEMAEIGQRTLDGSTLYADDPEGAQHEAGDLLRAGIDWARVKSLGNLVKAPPASGGAYVFKSVGTAAWDLAASRVALAKLQARIAAKP